MADLVFQGTTPLVCAKVPQRLDVSKATNIWVTVTQGDTIIAHRELSELTLDEQKVSFLMTQEETLAIVPKRKVKLQIRLLIDDKAYASRIVYADTDEVIKGGIIT